MDYNFQKLQIEKLIDTQLSQFDLVQSSDASYPNKLVETLRTSNQIEISNIKTKFKLIVNFTIEAILQQIQKELAQFISNSQMKYIGQFQIIEKQKNKIIENSSIIQDLIHENQQLKTQLQITSYDTTNQGLNLLNQSLLYELQRQINNQNEQLLIYDRQLKQKEEIIIYQQNEIVILKQQLNTQYTQEKEQVIQIQNQEQVKQIKHQEQVKQVEHQKQVKNRKSQATQIDVMELNKLNQQDQEILMSRKIRSQKFNIYKKNRTQTFSLSNTRQYQSQIQDQDLECQQLLDTKDLQFDKLHNNCLKIDYKFIKIKQRKLQNLNDLYLYSASQRNTRVDVDHYYEPSLLYRYNLLDSLKK